MAKTNTYLLVVASTVLCLWPASALAQVPDFTLNRSDQARLDSLAALTAKKIREAKLTEREPKVLVMDFFRDSPGTSSQLGTILADRFSESLSAYASEIRTLDRKVLKDYLLNNWTTLEDLKSYEVCFRMARQLAATGAILGTLTEKNGSVDLTLHLEGFGPPERENDIFAWRDRSVTLILNEDLRAALFQQGPNYARSADKIPEEPGVFTISSSVTPPECAHCPLPEYSDAARSSKFQGAVQLSVLVTAEGQATSIYVLKGAPFGLTTQAIKAAETWRFRPGLKDGKPVAVRITIETNFRLLSGPDSD